MAQINKPNTYFNTLLYSGNNTAQRQLTGVNFQPDLVWIKGRSGTYAAGYAHFVFDGVRGVGKQIHTNLSNAESTNLNNLYSFDSDGFSLGQSGVDSVTNGSSTEFVAWNWLASNTTASNTDGSITSTVSANTTVGFSIVTWTGDGNNMTVGHGLGVAPDVVLIKNRDNGSSNWVMRHPSLGNSNMLRLNDNTTGFTSTNYIVPTANTFSGQAATALSTLGEKVVGYCFAEKKGFSKFGSYTGNGSTDGPFIYTGFKPAMVIAKRTDSTGNWRIRDNKRSPNNVITDVLYPNSNSATITEDDHDFLSNGFKVRTTGPENNASGGTFIYLAFAENPLVGTNNIPATGR